MHLARAKLTYLVEQARSSPILLTRNGKPIVALVHPEVVENTESVHRSERSAVRANLLAALAILDAEK